MSKIRTINQLQETLDKEFSWRLKEIASLKSVVRASDNLSRQTAVRAAIPLVRALGGVHKKCLYILLGIRKWPIFEIQRASIVLYCFWRKEED